MKTTDFMVGDWLRTSRGIAKVIAVDKIGLTFKIDGGDFDIDKDDEEEWFDAAPLTHEVLIKIGFKKFKSPMGREYYEIPMEKAYVRFDTDFAGRIQGPNGNFEYKNIMFVHELQHAFRMCGIEKEIEL